MSRVDVRAGLDLPALPAEHRLHALLPESRGSAPSLPPWDAAFFGLDRVTRFRDADAGRRAAMVSAACAETLAEAWYIEKAGLAYTAKMALLARTTEERMLYALFAGDEARHYAAVSRFGSGRGTNPFLELLAATIEGGDRATLVFVVQVVLEGWGLVHYRQLAEQSADPALTVALQDILRDEARHHGSGVLLAQETPPTDDVLDVLGPLCDLVRAGPQMLAGVVEAATGPLSRAERVRVFAELDAEAHAGARLELLRDLMRRGGGAEIVEALESRRAFTPRSAEACA